MLTEHEQLHADNGDRLKRLVAGGHQVNGLVEHYMISLLEHLVGDYLPLVKVDYERWVAEQLTAVESALAKQRLLGGVHFTNGDKP